VNQPRPAPSRPADRYGERRSSRLLVAALAGTAVALLGWLLWVALSAATPDIRSSVISFRALDDRRVQVRFEVVADRSEAVTCSVQASGANGDVVGLTTVEVGPGPTARRETQAVLETRDRAATATVAGCRLGADD
jgi:hypothetical protein